jgi:hypothetical protein
MNAYTGPMIKRRVQIEKDLFFEYEVSPHRLILERVSAVSGRGAGITLHKNASTGLAIAGTHIPFKQLRSVGHFNPLKPPLDLETVLIGRALGQQAGYVHGVGYRIRDDGYVEGEFLQGIEKFGSFDEFVRSVKGCLPRSPDEADV